jgi:hypothetical protein
MSLQFDRAMAGQRVEVHVEGLYLGTVILTGRWVHIGGTDQRLLEETGGAFLLEWQVRPCQRTWLMAFLARLSRLLTTTPGHGLRA